MFLICIIKEHDKKKINNNTNKCRIIILIDNVSNYITEDGK